MTAEKQYSTALRTVVQLKDVAYHKWRDQVERVAYASEWHESILDEDVEPPAANDEFYFENKVDAKYAYMLCN